MSSGFTIRPLKCGHCGNELPVMGQFVTFQCKTCLYYWVLTAEGLKPITVHRALPQAESEEEHVLLPFWVIGVNSANLRTKMETTLEGLKSITKVIAGTKIEMEESEIENLLLPNAVRDPVTVKAHFISEATRTKKIPTASEINHLISRIERSGSFSIYVPAFLSLNTYAYLKAGRLFTRNQPSYGIEKSSGLGRPVMCALRADEAVALMDFVFFATLPESIQSNGDFLKELHLEPAGPARLIEFPFEQRGASLVSAIGDFSISSRLVEGIGQRNGAAGSSGVRQRNH